MKAVKLPSGNWRCRAYDSRTKSYKSFTTSTKKEAEYMALQFLNDRASMPTVKNETVGDCVQAYIDSKENILSQSSIRGYLIIRRNSRLCLIMSFSFCESVKYTLGINHIPFQVPVEPNPPFLTPSVSSSSVTKNCWIIP